jgi:hypothetical protein
MGERDPTEDWGSPAKRVDCIGLHSRFLFCGEKNKEEGRREAKRFSA